MICCLVDVTLMCPVSRKENLSYDERHKDRTNESFEHKFVVKAST